MTGMLVLWVCLVARPEACRIERIPTEARLELPAQCTAAAFEWAAGHPSVTVRRWRCGPVEHAI